MSFTIKKGNTSPFLVATLNDSTGTALDLTGATVVFDMGDLDGNSVVSNGACTIIGEDTGRVRYGWVANDTANAGIFRGEFTVTFASGRIETYPNSTTIRIKIKDSVG
tara:strand:- start:572 stop:895 length:324 start_codon:yes stop_codon:yes gene_type:complete